MDNDVVFPFKNSLHVGNKLHFSSFFFFFSFCNIIKPTFKTSLEINLEK